MDIFQYNKSHRWTCLDSLSAPSQGPSLGAHRPTCMLLIKTREYLQSHRDQQQCSPDEFILLKYLLLMNHFRTHSAASHFMLHAEEVLHTIAMELTELQTWLRVHHWHSRLLILLLLLNLLSLKSTLLKLSEQILLGIKHFSSTYHHIMILPCILLLLLISSAILVKIVWLIYS